MEVLDWAQACCHSGWLAADASCCRLLACCFLQVVDCWWLARVPQGSLPTCWSHMIAALAWSMVAARCTFGSAASSDS
jgi:hypothetical protein